MAGLKCFLFKNKIDIKTTHESSLNETGEEHTGLSFITGSEDNIE